MSDRDFFISRAGEDKDVALVIDEILRKAGYSTFIQDRDFGATSFPERMDEGFRMVERGARIIGLLSRAYQKKPHCEVESRYPLIDDPSNKRQRLIVLRIEECAPTGFLKALPYVDLVPLLGDAEKLAHAVIGAVDPTRKAAADFAALYRRAPNQILHPEVRAVPGFAARDAEMSALEGALWKKSGRAALTNSKGASAAVRGMGGVGKSVLAQQYAWDARGRYQGVWWLRAEQTETLQNDLIELGGRLIGQSVTEIADRAEAAQLVLDHITQTRWEKPWLLVYDNVEGPDAISKLTPADNAHVLITTRWADWYGHAEELPVDVFPRDVAIDYLMARARGVSEQPEKVRAAAGRLADDVGCLPLALALARAQAWGMNWSFEEYRRHLTEMLAREPTRAVSYPRSIQATFTLALDKAATGCPEAEKMMGIAAYLAPDRIPLDIITHDVMSDIERGEAVAALAEVSLVSQETLEDGTPGISVHRLVQEVMRGRLGEAGTAAAEQAMVLVSMAYPSGEKSPTDVRNWPACRRLEAHAKAVLEHLPGTCKPIGELLLLLNQLGQHLHARAEFASAEQMIRRLLATVEATYPPDHPELSIALNNLSGLLQDTNRLAEAEPIIRRAVAIDEAAYGPDHHVLGLRLNNLALILRDTNRYTEAEELMRRALGIVEKTYPSDHPEIANLLNNLAVVLEEGFKRYEESEELKRRAIAIDEAHFGPDHPSVSIRVSNLAVLLHATERYEEAELLSRRSLKIDETSFGPSHPNVAVRLNNLAQILQATDRYGEAEPLMRRALTIDQSTFGPDHPNVAIRLNNLARLFEDTGRLQDALPLMRQAAEILEISLGADHPNTVTVKNNLGFLLKRIDAEVVAQQLTPPAEAGGAPAAREKGNWRTQLARLFGRK